MKKAKILIHQSEDGKHHSTLWNFPWVEYCESVNLDYKLIDLFRDDAIKIIGEFDILLWHFNGYNMREMQFARSIINAAKVKGLKVFPDFNDSWHFDDKIAETYLLQAAQAPIPRSRIYYRFEDLEIAIARGVEYPIVAKLKNGSGAHNVKLLNSDSELLSYGRIMFSRGFDASPSVKNKALSNIRSATSFKKVFSRMARIPEFFRTLRDAQEFPMEKGYVFLQEFIQNGGYDLKIVVVGKKLSYIGRNVRKGDFRASGGGDLFFDRTIVAKNIIDSAFNTSMSLGFKCMGYDYVVDKNTGVGKIVEISYGFSHAALLEAKGYFDINGNWYDEPLDAPRDILRNLLKM